MVEYWECNDTASVGASYCNWEIMIFPGVIRSGIGMVSSTKNYIDSFFCSIVIMVIMSIQTDPQKC